MCDEGRYGFHHVHSDRRLTNVERRDGTNVARLEWSQALREIDQKFRAAGSVAAMISPDLSIEEAYLLAKYVRQVDARALIVPGTNRNARRGRDVQERFYDPGREVVRSPWVEEIVANFMGRVATVDDLLAGIEAGEVRALWASGGYKQDWIDVESAERLAAVDCLVVAGSVRFAAVGFGHLSLTAAAFAEREGSYVNYDATACRAWPGPFGLRPECVPNWEFMGTTGHARVAQGAARVGRSRGADRVFFAGH